MKITFKAAGSEDRTIEVHGSLTLMEAAVRHGIDEILAECGGACSCATCHVYVPDEWLAVTGEAGGMELELLECVEARRPGSRLSCQINLSPAMDGLTVKLPPA